MPVPAIKKHHYKPLLQKDIEAAQANTNSAAAAARYLGVDYKTYKRYAQMYGVFEQHLNTTGKGIPRRKKHYGAFSLDAILAGNHPGYSRTKLKDRLIAAGYLSNQCALCDFDEQRYLDGKVPLVLYYKDGNHRNLQLDNLELRCYNCTFLTTGQVYVKEVRDIVRGAELSVDISLSDEEIEELQKKLQTQLMNENSDDLPD